MRWYHKFFLSWSAMLAIAFVFALIGMLQFSIYEAAETFNITFDGVCTPNSPAETEDGVDWAKFTVQCGDIELKPYETDTIKYLQMLATGQDPVLTCKRKEGKYTGLIHWECDPKIIEDTTI